jgi:hypothetical protein
MAQAVGYLPSKNEVLSLNPSTIKKKEKWLGKRPGGMAQVAEYLPTNLRL